MPITIQKIRGVDLDRNTRCAHYHGPTDIISIRMRCCQTYYACIECHAELAGHPAKGWPEPEWDTPAVFCGACSKEMSVAEYLHSDNRCPGCAAAFNPGCRNHYHLYFETAAPSR